MHWDQYHPLDLTWSSKMSKCQLPTVLPLMEG
jgi:hypothetical protein